MKNNKLTNKKVSVVLNDCLQMRKINLGVPNDENLSKCICHQTIGIWSKPKGMEWGHELAWMDHTNIKFDEHSIYKCATSNKHALKLEIEDFSHINQNLFFRKITLHNNAKEEQDLKLFFQQDFDENGITFFSLGERTLYHESGGLYMLFNGLMNKKGISQYTTFSKNDYSDRTLYDMKNGNLYFNPISTGRVISAFSLETILLPYEIKHGYYWMAIGKNIGEVNLLNDLVKQDPDWLINGFFENDFSDLDKMIQSANKA